MYEVDSHLQQKITRETTSALNSLGPDLIELILSHLPIPSIIRTTSVCKSWNSIIHSVFFKTNRSSASKSLPWFFIHSHNYMFLNSSHIFAFDPESDKWFKLPDQNLLFKKSLTVTNRFIFAISPENSCFKPVFSQTWHQLAPLRFSSCEHLIGVYEDPDCSNLIRFIIVAADFNGYFAVNIYNPRRNAWELCPPPPQVFSSRSTSNLLSSAIFRNKFYLFGVSSGFISSFDLGRRIWSDAQSLRPPGVQISYLVLCQDHLVLAGCSNYNGEPEFNLWRIDERTLEYRKIGAMPEKLLSCFFGSERERLFTWLKCIGSGNLVYVFSEWKCVACVCEISSGLGECMWRRIPCMPEPVTRLQNYSSFCSHVSVQDILGNDRSNIIESYEQ